MCACTHALQGVCKGVALTQRVEIYQMLQAVLEGSLLLSDVRRFFYSTRTKRWCRVTLRTMLRPVSQ